MQIVADLGSTSLEGIVCDDEDLHMRIAPTRLVCCLMGYTYACAIL